MDRFPQYPPFPNKEPGGDWLTQTQMLQFWAFIIGCNTAWILALLAVGYWVAGGPSIGPAYLHGVLLGMLLGMALVSAVITPRKETPQ
jgi:hypothetical protein